MLFFGSSTIDLKITVFLLVVSFLISIVVWFVSRKSITTILTLSVLANISFLVNLGSEMFDYYGIMWLKYFSFYIWPVLNIFLIIYYIRTNPKK